MIVGVEGGEHAAFKEPPYYDPKALMQNRIIIAAFNAGGDLPKSKTRVARLHLRLAANIEPNYQIKLNTAATADGSPIPAAATIGQGEAR